MSEFECTNKRKTVENVFPQTVPFPTSSLFLSIVYLNSKCQYMVRTHASAHTQACIHACALFVTRWRTHMHLC